MRNVLNRKKNHISDFSDFHFSGYGHFCTKNYKFLMNFHDNSKNKNQKNREINFSFDSAHSAFFMKIGATLRGEEGGGGVHIIAWDSDQNFQNA